MKYDCAHLMKMFSQIKQEIHKTMNVVFSLSPFVGLAMWKDPIIGPLVAFSTYMYNKSVKRSCLTISWTTPRGASDRGEGILTLNNYSSQIICYRLAENPIQKCLIMEDQRLVNG